MNSQMSRHQLNSNVGAVQELMVVTIDSFNMLVPREDIKTFESIHDLETGDLCKNSIGWMRYLGSKLPVYCFTGDFEMSNYLLENRPICVVLNKVNLAFMCSDIKLLNTPVESILPLPDCMAHSASPVHGFCLSQGDRINNKGMYCNSESINRFIESSKK